jgi:hypothetical protein
LGIFRLEGTGVAVRGFVDPDIGLVAILGFWMASGSVGQALAGGTDELVPLGVIGEILGTEKCLADQLGFAVFLLFPVESVVFDIVAQLMIFEINVVLFTTLTCIGADVFG